ncbi:hypothetical protein [Halioxenophilus aromaticivorans]|uniref:Kynureninase n=1 Tax=Halioxenophilus aromaticivorans TaxID=1306992 RepID=A0AAV3TZI2_9ALTE
MSAVEPFSRNPNLIAPHYQHAQVELKLMLTGHVYQAVPDVAKAGYAEHWQCLSKYGNERVDIELEKTELVRQGFAQLVESQPGCIALAASVHELFVRFLSCLDYDKRKKIITTTGEHPSILRQLVRCQDLGIELVLLDPAPASNLVERVLANLDDDTLAVCLSTVDHTSGHQVWEVDTLMAPCASLGIELFIDAYHSVNVLSFSVAEHNLQQAFVVAGGAKYCQMGDGNCFMHVPPWRDFKPAVTGWFGVFDPNLDSPSAQPLAYADAVGQRFDGSTRDMLPYFRAVKVFDYFRQQQLTPELLHDINHHQLSTMAVAFSQLDLDPKVVRLSTSVEFMGGFLSIKTPFATALQAHMRDIGVICDYKSEYLRLGPAPYLCDEQLLDCVEALRESVAAL